jgi:hypothetical protein
MKLHGSLSVLVMLFAPFWASAQVPAPVAFGCGEQRTEFDEKPVLAFESITDAAAIREWETRPVLAFKNFSAAKYGFTEARFYRWHVPVPGREGNEQSFNHNSSQRLDLAIQLTTPNGPRWFHLEIPKGIGDDVLYIQPDPSDTGQGESSQAAEASDGEQLPDKPKLQDEMEAWLTLKLASPNVALPIFLLDFAYNDSGANAAGTIRNELLVDFKNGVPRIAKVARCILWEGGGVCGAPDTGNLVPDQLTCNWDPTAEDFHCVMISAYGSSYSPLTAQRDFYLLSADKQPRPAWFNDDVASDLGTLALRLRGATNTPSEPRMVEGIGPAILIADYKDLLPNAEVLLFASPAASSKVASRFNLVTLPANAKPTVQAVSKWDISGDQTDEANAPAGYTPVRAQHKYRARSLESRPGFHAVEIVLASQPQAGGSPTHVVYWVGIEVVNGALVTNSVRLASEGTWYAGCGRDLEDGTAISVQRSSDVAEATIRVQPQEDPMAGENDPQPCAWNGSLHWKLGAGFRVRKLGELCKSVPRNVSITDDGSLTSKVRPKDQQ